MSFIKPSGRSDMSARAIQASEIVTSVPALALLKQASLVPSPPPNMTLLDNACGSGVLTSQLLSHVSSTDLQSISTIICADLDLTMIDTVNDRIKSQSWPSSVEAQHLDSHDTKLPGDHFAHVLMNFGPQLMRDAKQMLIECHRILQPHGTLGFTTWVRPGFMASMRAVFPDFNPGATPVAGEWRDAGKMEEILTDLGFEYVRVEECAFESEHEDLDGYLELFTEVLMKGFFDRAAEDAKERYAEYIRRPGNMRMEWMALVVTAKKQ